ncbi:hypothetical protein [uncultured Nitrospira sp.]
MVEQFNTSNCNNASHCPVHTYRKLKIHASAMEDPVAIERTNDKLTEL